MNGKDKTINFNVDYLGAIKQIPVLIRELQHIIPAIKTNIFCSDYAGESGIGSLEENLRSEGIERELINITEDRNYFRRMDHDLDVDLNLVHSSYKGNFSHLSFHIDPLKFEKRRLLDKDQIKEIKERYFINSSKVLLWGAIHHGTEYKICAQTTSTFLKSHNLQTIIVPREDPFEMCRELSFFGVDFSTDQEHSSLGKNCLVITQKGILDKLYSICDTAILGYGQNPLEPAFYNKEILVPFTGVNNEVAYDGLERSGLLRRIAEDVIVEEVCREIPPDFIGECGRKAQKFIDSQKGVAKRYAKIIQFSLYEMMNPRKWREMIKNS